MAKGPSYEFSPTVSGVFDRLESAGDITSWRITQDILKEHPEYGNRQGRRMGELPGPQGMEAHPIAWWRDRLFNLFDPGKAHYVHGRLVILGLAELDAVLKKFLIQMDFYDRLRKEMKEPFETMVRTADPNDQGEKNQVITQQVVQENEPKTSVPRFIPGKPSPIPEVDKRVNTSKGGSRKAKSVSQTTTPINEATKPIEQISAPQSSQPRGKEETETPESQSMVQQVTQKETANSVEPEISIEWTNSRFIMYEEYIRSLRMAILVAEQAKRPADSTILLAVLLHLGALAAIDTTTVMRKKPDPMSLFQEPKTLGALVVWAIVQQRYPKDVISDLNSFYRELAGELPPSENGSPNLTIPVLLGLDTDYGITEFPTLPQTRPVDLPDLSGTELAEIDHAARAFAAQATPRGVPEPGHLLAALLAPRLASPFPTVQRRLLIQGCDLSGLRRALLDAVLKTRPGDTAAVWESAMLAPDPYVPPIAGYASDYVREDTVDRLDIESEVANIASVLTYKEVTPPLSLGLFGDWGSGKTFFMTRLQAAIARSTAYFLEQERASKDNTPAAWCSRVVQINFNAWNYSDTNLWACLVTRIFEALYAEFNDADAKDQAYKKKIEEEVSAAKGAVSQAQADKALADDRVTKAHEALIQAQKERAEKENDLRGLVSDLKKLLTDGEEKKKLDQATEALGYPEAAETYEALRDLNTNLQSFSSRASALLVTSYRSHWTLLILALCVIALPVLTTLFVENALPAMGQIGQRVTEISVFLAGLIASVKFQLDRGMAWVQQIEDAFQKAQKIRQERLEGEAENGEVKQARDALVLAESQEQAAAATLQNAQADLQRLQAELAEFRPDRRFYRLIEERSQSEAYRQYLGIISLIRTDFEKISQLMLYMAREGDKRNMATEPPPIQRIILYIDDLDRCRPERVVEVLEAVHLLLAFPLFVVVVGVDPRWLHQSLRQHYASTLNEAAPESLRPQPAEPNGRIMPGYATPQDYLEKIFQIPYALKPVEQSGFQNLVGELIKPVRGNKPQPPAPSPRSGEGEKENRTPPTDGENGADTLPVEKPTGEGISQIVPSNGGGTAAPDGGARPTEGTAAQAGVPAFSPLAQGQLDFTEAEQKDILLLWPLFRTPRTIKRYVNLYRLLRASLRTQKDLTLFEGDARRPGDYRVAMLILAVVTSYPNHAERFLNALDEWIQEVEDAEATPQPGDGPASARRTLCWTDFIQYHRQKYAQSTGKSTNPQPVKSQPGLVNDTISEEVQGEMSWDRLLDGLEQVCTGAQNFDPASAEALHHWAVRVSRYSFTIG